MQNFAEYRLLRISVNNTHLQCMTYATKPNLNITHFISNSFVSDFNTNFIKFAKSIPF